MKLIDRLKEDYKSYDKDILFYQTICIILLLLYSFAGQQAKDQVNEYIEKFDYQKCYDLRYGWNINDTIAGGVIYDPNNPQLIEKRNRTMPYNFLNCTLICD